VGAQTRRRCSLPAQSRKNLFKMNQRSSLDLKDVEESTVQPPSHRDEPRAVKRRGGAEGRCREGGEDGGYIRHRW